jgi:hypothetical protein
MKPTEDRDAFGHWLSGFVDGEGHFRLQYSNSKGKKSKHRLQAVFRVSVRSDDIKLLFDIQDYLDIGRIYLHANEADRRRGLDAMPSCRFTACSKNELEILVNHFDKYPLRSKKARDYAIWREGALMRMKHKTFQPWAEQEIDKFVGLTKQLIEVREYEYSLSLTLGELRCHQ